MADDSKRAPAQAGPSHPPDASIADRTLALLARRSEGATICPSEVARSLQPARDGWRALMPQVRDVAARMADAGLIEVTQRGAVVDARTARGAIRLRRVAAPPLTGPDREPPQDDRASDQAS